MVTDTIKTYSRKRHAVADAGTPSSGYWGKRVFDLTISLFIIVFVLSWLMPVIGLAIILSSPGPALFVQIRSGRNGRQFRCYKFRTMFIAPRHNHPFRQAFPDDPRVTPLGRLLRRTNLDEIPQFLNVLLGNMSLVGPRPHPIELDAQYWYKLPGYARRYDLKPGITGLAQVRGYRGAVMNPLMMKHRVRYDRFYIQKASPMLDVSICLQTLVTMLTGNTDAF
ncbi:putative colanic acid biosynthesis UDP-glucose lipid carrier transferase [Spirosoma lacussanchae]|uniref:sugar transferase n=1 Tax=Spirosoma lacussanchae TaxID=1884249 RepID=UPI00110916E9|nr:sugar transferase [Spirosoma lacussanchae]